MKRRVLCLALVAALFVGCRGNKESQVISFEPEMTSVDTTATGCEIYDSKDFDAKTVYADYAISLSKREDIDTEFEVSIPQVEKRDTSNLEAVNQQLYNNGTLEDCMQDPEVSNFEAGYGVTFAEYNVISVYQQVRCVASMHDMEFAYGCTFDRDSDTVLPLNKYFDSKQLMDLYNSGDLKIYMNQGYDDETIEMLLQEYVDYSDGTETSYFINKNSIFIIIPVSGANSTYFIVEAARG